MRILSRRGTTMVEAAVVFPLVILTMITCMLICMFFYGQTIEQSTLHTAMRQAAGEANGRTEYFRTIRGDHGSISIERAGLFDRVRGRENVAMLNKGIIRGRTDQRIESLWTASDGVAYVRYCTLASKVIDGR